MYLSRIRVRPSDLLARGAPARDPDHYAVHQLVWRWFGDRADRERDFLYRWELTPHEVVVYTLGHREPGPPAPWDCQTRPFRPVFHEGAAYRFTLRANPTRRAGRPEEGRAQRVDVVMHARKLAALEGRNERPIYEAGREWLARQGERAGFALTDDLIVGGYQQVTFRRRRGSDSAIRLSQLEFDGTLIVRHPERFGEQLIQGFGSAKAFGFGLMLVKPVR